LSGATLNNTTFTGTITGISTNPTVTSVELTSNVNLNYSTFTNLLSASVSAGSYMVFGRVYATAAGPTTTTSCGIFAEIYNTENISPVYRAGNFDVGGSVYAGTTTVFGVVTLASSGTIGLRALGQGGAGTPVAYGLLGGTMSFSSFYVMRIA
jgi:hypothetical protein